MTVAGVLVGLALVRLAGQRESWLRAALLAQTADLVTFAAVWEHSQGELNPLGLVVRDLAHLVFGEASGSGIPIAWLVLTVLKVGLIGFLIRVAPLLGRYRRLVLAVAVLAGTLGAASNVVAHPNGAGSLLVLGAYVVVAIRAPSRFGDALRLGALTSGVVLLALGGVATIANIPYVAHPYVCGAIGCPPWLASGLTLLGTGLIAAALVAVWLTLRFTLRLLPWRVAHAD